jgi:hypothetical protein
MARMPDPLKLFALLALLCAPGCASWRERNRVATADAPSTDGGGNTPLLDAVSQASLNNWNFRK